MSKLEYDSGWRPSGRDGRPGYYVMARVLVFDRTLEDSELVLAKAWMDASDSPGVTTVESRLLTFGVYEFTTESDIPGIMVLPVTYDTDWQFLRHKGDVDVYSRRVCFAYPQEAGDWMATVCAALERSGPGSVLAEQVGERSCRFTTHFPLV